jgi:Transposase IS66 family
MQSAWCGDVADLLEPLYQLMADRVRASHVVATDDTIMPMLSVGKAANARMALLSVLSMPGLLLLRQSFGPLRLKFRGIANRRNPVFPRLSQQSSG